MSAVLEDKRIVLVLLKTFSNQLLILDVPEDIIIVLQRQMINVYLKRKANKDRIKSIMTEIIAAVKKIIDEEQDPHKAKKSLLRATRPPLPEGRV